MTMPAWHADPLARLRFRLSRMEIYGVVTLEELPDVSFRCNEYHQFYMVTKGSIDFRGSGKRAKQMDSIVAEVARRMGIHEKEEGDMNPPSDVQINTLRRLSDGIYHELVDQRTVKALLSRKAIEQHPDTARHRFYRLTDAGRALLPPDETAKVMLVVESNAPVGTAFLPSVPDAPPSAAAPADIEPCADCGCLARRVLDIVMESVPDARLLYDLMEQEDRVRDRLRQMSADAQ